MNFWSNCSKREQQKASPIPHELCPLFEPSIYVCPDCGQNFIEKDDIFYCRECSKYYDAEEILGEKKYAKKIITL